MPVPKNHKTNLPTPEISGIVEGDKKFKAEAEIKENIDQKKVLERKFEIKIVFSLRHFFQVYLL